MLALAEWLGDRAIEDVAPWIGEAFDRVSGTTMDDLRARFDGDAQ